MFSPQQQQQQQDEDEEQQSNGLGFCSFCVELVGGTSKKQNWKGLGIAFIVIIFICLLIGGAILATRDKQIDTPNLPIAIHEDDLHKIKLPKSWNGTWISDRYFSFSDENNSIWIYDCHRLSKELVFARDLIQDESVDEGIVSPSARFILIPIRKEKTHPYYNVYQYNLYEKKKLIDQQTLPISSIVYSHSDEFFAFVSNFNVYIYDTRIRDSIQITFDGNQNTIHNGLIEWIYEYEIFNDYKLLFWSPTDTHLAFIKINLSNLSKSHFLRYDFAFDDADKYSIPYPKYNETIPTLDAYIYSIQTKKLLKIPRPLNKKSLVYIHHFVWYNDKSFSIVYGNRRGNYLVVQLYEIFNDQITVKNSYIEETKRGFLLARHFKPYFHFSGTYIYLIRFQSKSYPRVMRIYFNQTYPQIDGRSSEEIIADEIRHVDNYGHVYFTGSFRNNSYERQLFRWNYSSTDCLSCNLSCGFVNAQFSQEYGNYYILECLGPSVPYSILFNTTTNLTLINDNQEFRNWTDKRLMPYIDFFSVPLDSKTPVGHGMIILPADYSPNRTIASYPVLVLINDRLADHRVNKRFILPLAEYIQVVEDQIGIVLFDSHGSTGQDENYWKNNYQNWFERQYKDYVQLAKYLKSNQSKFYGTLNETRFGLKADGPAAVIAMKVLGESDEYQCAFLRSPVNDLSHYYATYSERIHGLKINPKSSYRTNFENKSIAIVHGTADEIVHFKHSATLAKSLTTSRVQYDFKVYPDVTHYFEDDPKIYNDFLLYQRQFFQKHLGGQILKERTYVILEEEHD